MPVLWEDHTSVMEGKKPEKDEKENKFVTAFLDDQVSVMSGVEMMREQRKLGKRDFVMGVTHENSLFFPISIPNGCRLSVVSNHAQSL